MFLILLIPILATTASAQYPSCGRRGMLDLHNPASSNFLLEPGLQNDAARCESICGLTPACGGVASTGKKRPADWCLIFRAGVSYEDVFGSSDDQWSVKDGIPVGFWEASCLHPPSE